MRALGEYLEPFVTLVPAWRKCPGLPLPMRRFFKRFLVPVK